MLKRFYGTSKRLVMGKRFTEASPSFRNTTKIRHRGFSKLTLPFSLPHLELKNYDLCTFKGLKRIKESEKAKERIVFLPSFLLSLSLRKHSLQKLFRARGSGKNKRKQKINFHNPKNSFFGRLRQCDNKTAALAGRKGMWEFKNPRESTLLTPSKWSIGVRRRVRGGAVNITEMLKVPKMCEDESLSPWQNILTYAYIKINFYLF